MDEMSQLPDGKEKDAKQGELLKLNKNIIDNYDAIRKCTREASNIFRLAQAYLDNTKSLIYMEREYKQGRGLKDLTPEQAEEVKKAYGEIKKKDERIKELEEEARILRQKEDNETKYQEDKKSGGKFKRLTAEEKTSKADRGKALAGNLAEYLASRAGVIKTLEGVDKPDVKKDLRELAGIVSDLITDEIRGGANSLLEAIDRVHEILGGKIDKQFINDAYAGEFTKGTRKTKGAIEQKLSDTKVEAKLVTKLSKLDKDGLPEKQDPKDKKANARIDDLRKKIKDKEEELKKPEKDKIAEEKKVQKDKERLAKLSEQARVKEEKRIQREKERAEQKIENEKKRKQKVIDDLKKEILDLQKGIDTRRVKAESKVDPGIKKLREKRDAEKKKLGISDEEWNKREIEKNKKQQAQAEDDLKNKRFEKPQKAVRDRYVTPELERARADKANAVFKWDVERYKDQMGKRSGFEKFIDKTIKVRTAIGLLSGIRTLGKLFNYTVVELAYKEPTDMLMDGMISLTPGLRAVAKKSSIHGHFDLDSTKQALGTSLFNAKTFKDAVSYVTSEPHTHELYSRFKPGAELAEFKSQLGKVPTFGTLHGAEKYPLWKFTFDKTANKLLKFHAIRGADLEDKGLLKLIDAQAADVANRRIMMNKNILTDFLKHVQQHLYNNYGWRGKTGYYISKVLFPIVTVPTNFAAKMVRLTSGWGEFAIRMSKGVDNMTEDDANKALLALKEGLQGTGMAIGLALASNTATYDKKTKKFYLLGMEVPNWLAHHPDIAVVKLFAEAKAEFNSKNGNLLTAAETLPLEITKEVPFLSDRTLGMIDSPAKLNYFLQNLALSFVEPQMLRDIASWTDKDYSERHAKTFKEHAQLGVPGVSKNVSTDLDRELDRLKKADKELTPEEQKEKDDTDEKNRKENLDKYKTFLKQAKELKKPQSDIDLLQDKVDEYSD
jgi:hypothetical protein